MNAPTKLIVVVEPSRIMRKLLEAHFQLAGHCVVTFEHYTDALHTLPRYPAQAPGLAFVAVHARIPESTRLLQCLRQLHPHMPIAAITTQEDSIQHTVQKVVQETNAVLVITPFRIEDVLTLCNPDQLPQKQGIPTI